MTALSTLEKLWLTEAIRLRESHAGALDDSEANRVARQQGGDLGARVINRALWLAQRDGLLAALKHWQQGARLAVLVLAVLALFSGAGLAFAALGNGARPVNVFWALGSLLGLDLLMLLGWLGGLLFAGGHGASLGRLWWWLSEKLARDAKAAHLAPALVVLLQRRRLNRWVLGALVHGLWLVALLAALVVALLLLATRRYGFVWETTLLGADSFVGLTESLGALPAWLGFNVPDAAMIAASGGVPLDADAARQAWAGWLIGVLVLYGIAPRLLLAAFCLLRWHGGRTQLDLQLADHEPLRGQLMPSSERLGVSDAAPPPLASSLATTTAGASSGALLVGLELDDQRAWPPTLPVGVSDAGHLDDRLSRQRLLEQLTRFPAARLLIACDPLRSPDRGSLALIAELSRCAASTRVWLLPAPPGQIVDARRLAAWHEALAPFVVSDPAPLNWLETGHD
ncbi:DUF2868 domain-containing protein [Pseudomonas sp. HR96]|uniref:DUF2868 domain-containing protein n=1 Tax=Pseudomonas sp. HR96 TaxID=1027966 RepID=UPI002A75A06F|nr:DUF2868 domain-containing protein [Pseudomonas sp. HR96]WPP00177.1 DUF2868 domain-containing protein [Pseudomonas sp. HR96]